MASPLVIIGALGMLMGVLQARMEGPFRIGPQGLEGRLAETASAVIEEGHHQGIEGDKLAQAIAQAVNIAVAEEAAKDSPQDIARNAIKNMVDRAAPGGPMDTLFAWLDAAWTHKSVRAAWPLTDERLRTAMATAWVNANKAHPAVKKYDPDDVVQGLSAPYPAHPLWDSFEATTLDEMREVWGEDFRVEDYGASSAYRPVAPDYELFYLTKTHGEAWLVERPTLVPAKAFLLRQTDEGWRVSALGPTPPTEALAPSVTGANKAPTAPGSSSSPAP